MQGLPVVTSCGFLDLEKMSICVLDDKRGTCCALGYCFLAPNRSRIYRKLSVYIAHNSFNSHDTLKVQRVGVPETLLEETRDSDILPAFPSMGRQKLLDLLIICDKRLEPLPQMPGKGQPVVFQAIMPFLVFESDLLKEPKPCRELAVRLECEEGKVKCFKNNACGLELGHRSILGEHDQAWAMRLGEMESKATVLSVSRGGVRKTASRWIESFGLRYVWAAAACKHAASSWPIILLPAAG